MKYLFITKGKNGLESKIYEKLEDVPYSLLGYTHRTEQRKELWNSPRFKGFMGAMYQDDETLRYESREAFDILSN